MNTLELQRLILATDLMPTEKLVGMALALHLSVSSMTIRIRQQTLARECGLSARSIRRAISGLVAVGLFESRVTGRASILVPVESVSAVKNSGIVERPRRSWWVGRVNKIWARPTGRKDENSRHPAQNKKIESRLRGLTWMMKKGSGNGDLRLINF